MVDSVTASRTAGTSGLNSTRQGIADNFDTFLQLLTTQLQNQNPLEPLDTNQFTQQLVQFSSVEQQLKTNEFLEAMLSASQVGQAGQAVSYIGKTVMSSGAQAELANGQATWSYTASAAAPNTTVTVRDESGEIVYQQRTSLTAGSDQLAWDGTTIDGSQRTSGLYSVTIEARDAQNNLVPVTTEVGGVVRAVDLSGSEPVLIVNNSRIPLSQVSSVETSPAA